MIALQAGDWTARLAPKLGGAMLGLDWRGLPIFRPTPARTADILGTACFPLVPYANRVADGRFSFGGREVTLPALTRFAPHALHGDGWLNPWAVEARDGVSARMTLGWPGATDGWPWPWRAVQTIALAETGLTIDLSVTNTGDQVMPAGLGLHPYFHRAADARLTLPAEGVWLTDAREIPDRLAPPGTLMDWSPGAALHDAPFVDHAYAGWSGAALIEGGGRRVAMVAGPNVRWAQVYAPPNEDFFCVEPVTHRPDALNAPADERSGLVALAPGETLSMAMSLSVRPVAV